MLPAELARQIRLLEIRTDHLVEEITGGAYRSVFKGRGIEFDEVREYTTDDDVRTIDWNVSARMGSAYVKKFVEERELVVMLAVDLSASGDFGAAAKSKRQTAAELAALLAFSAGRNGDKVGLILFTDELELYLPPRAGRKHALRIIRELLAFQPHHRGTDIDGVLQETAKLMKKRGIVFLLSDLNDPEKFQTSLKLLKLRQDVVAIELRDPVETDFPLDCPVVFEDAVQRIICGNIYAGRPVWRSDNNDGIRVIVPDDRNDDIGVFLDLLPLDFVRLIADLINHIVFIFTFF